jgi:competence protein ComEC
VAIPVSSLIILLEIALCLLNWVPGIAWLTGEGVYFLIKLMNEFVSRLMSIPFAVWDQISITSLQAVALYVFMVSIAGWLKWKKTSTAYLGLCGLLLFVFIRHVELLRSQTPKLIVYNLTGHTLMDLIVDRHATMFADSALIANPAALRKVIVPSRIVNRLAWDTTSQPVAAKNGFLLMCQRRRICYVASTLPCNPEFMADVAVISGNAVSASEFFSACRANTVVIDASVSEKNIGLWAGACRRYGVRLINIRDCGAFVVRLN